MVPGSVGGWAWHCTRHGHAVIAWTQPKFAALDALGHIAAHHAIPPLPSEPVAPSDGPGEDTPP